MFQNIRVHIPKYYPSINHTHVQQSQALLSLKKSPILLDVDEDEEDVAFVSSATIHSTHKGILPSSSPGGMIDVAATMLEKANESASNDDKGHEASSIQLHGCVASTPLQPPVHQQAQQNHDTHDPINTSFQLISSTTEAQKSPIPPTLSVVDKIQRNQGELILDVEEFMETYYGRLQKLEETKHQEETKAVDATENDKTVTQTDENPDPSLSKETPSAEDKIDEDKHGANTSAAVSSSTHPNITYSDTPKASLPQSHSTDEAASTDITTNETTAGESDNTSVFTKLTPSKTLIKYRRKKRRKQQDYEHVYVINDPSIQSEEQFLDARANIEKTNNAYISDNANRIDQFSFEEFKPLFFHYVQRRWIDECDDILINISDMNQAIYEWRSSAEERAFQEEQKRILYKSQRPKRKAKHTPQPFHSDPDSPMADTDEAFSPDEKDLPTNMQFRPQTRQSIEELKKQGYSEEEIAKMHPRERAHADIENPTPMCTWKNIPLTLGDYNRLEPFEYLNDNILDMARERLEIPDNCLVYNTFFYRFLERNMGRAAKTVPPQKTAVFDKDYLFIPINRNLHWSLLIVCIKGVRHLQKKVKKRQKRKKATKRRSYSQPNGDAAPNACRKGKETENDQCEENQKEASDNMADVSTTDSGKSTRAKALEKDGNKDGQSDRKADVDHSKTTDDVSSEVKQDPMMDAETQLAPANEKNEGSAMPDEVAAMDAHPRSTTSANADMSSEQRQPDTEPPITSIEPVGQEKQGTGEEENIEPTDDKKDSPKSSEQDGDRTHTPVVLSESQRAIIGCDSLRQSNFLHGAMAKVRQYLAIRWDIERGKPDDEPASNFTTSEFKGSYASLPMQDNDCDCGVFVVRYIQDFLKNPPTEIPVIREDMFTVESIAESRKEMQEFIRGLAEEQNFAFPTDEDKEKQKENKDNAPAPANVMDTSSDSDLEIISVTPAPKRNTNRRKKKESPVKQPERDDTDEEKETPSAKTRWIQRKRRSRPDMDSNVQDCNKDDTRIQSPPQPTLVKKRKRMPNSKLVCAKDSPNSELKRRKTS